jgi:hypothetical protein
VPAWVLSGSAWNEGVARAGKVGAASITNSGVGAASTTRQIQQGDEDGEEGDEACLKQADAIHLPQLLATGVEAPSVKFPNDAGPGSCRRPSRRHDGANARSRGRGDPSGRRLAAAYVATLLSPDPGGVPAAGRRAHGC